MAVSSSCSSSLSADGREELATEDNIAAGETNNVKNAAADSPTAKAMVDGRQLSSRMTEDITVLIDSKAGGIHVLNNASIN